MSHLYNKEIDFLAQRRDAFGRLRVSNPVRLFDSFSRYVESDQFHTANSASGSSTTFNTNTSMLGLNVTTLSGSYVYRESRRIFAYQPGKSLLVEMSFVMNSNKTGLRQRVGYFSTQNGIFVELDSTGLKLVKRSYISGLVVDTAILQSNWNYDKLDGNGPSGKTIDITKSQLFWTDIEWLGVGTVRVGFIIDGEYYICHKFDCANVLASTYMTTACLPVRYEIENMSTTATDSTLYQVCSTVISEGGYDVAGRPKTIGHAPNSPISLTTAGVYYPTVAIRLKSTRLDGISIPVSFSVLGVSNGNYRVKLVKDATVSGGTWVDYGTNSNIEYNINPTSYTGGVDMVSTFLSTTNQDRGNIDKTPDLFSFQLERNSFTSTPSVFLLSVSGSASTLSVLGSIDFQDIT